MELAYTQPTDLETIDLVDNQAESRLDFRNHFSPDPQETSQLLSEVAQPYPLRPPPRSYISSPPFSTAFSFSNTFEPDSSPSGFLSKAHQDGLLASPHTNHQRVASGDSGDLRVLFRLPDENGVHGSREKPNIQFASTSTRYCSTYSSGESSLLFPCDHSRYPLEKFRKLEGFVAYNYDLYEDKEPDHDDWLHDPDSNTPLPNKRFALPWRGIANVGFLAILLIIIFFLFVGLPIYTTIMQDRGVYIAV